MRYGVRDTSLSKSLENEALMAKALERHTIQQLLGKQMAERLKVLPC
tara:strand:+ start:279 stop:419 length:141 start_codon:yes stop_codon:yes gene_type:complete